MRIAVVTDAWEPQVNGVVNTLKATVECLRGMGHEVADRRWAVTRGVGEKIPEGKIPRRETERPIIRLLQLRQRLRLSQQDRYLWAGAGRGDGMRRACFEALTLNRDEVRKHALGFRGARQRSNFWNCCIRYVQGRCPRRRKPWQLSPPANAQNALMDDARVLLYAGRYIDLDCCKITVAALLLLAVQSYCLRRRALPRQFCNSL